MTEATITDYSSLIDTETWAFIRETESWYPPQTATFSIERQREIYDALCRAFHNGYPPGISVHDEALGGVTCRIYEKAPSPVTVLYLHGGGFVVGGLESHDDICAEICARTGYRVVAPDYRLAPEHRHPAHFADARSSLLAVAAKWGGSLILAGDSAGGALAASLAHDARTLQPPLALGGQVLIYPALGGDMGKGSYVRHARAPMLSRDDVLYYHHVRFQPGYDATGDVSAQALHDHDFSRLPPTMIFTAECDPLCDDGAQYAEHITRAGGLAHSQTEIGLVHGYLRARHSVARARASFTGITEAISALGRGEIPWRGAL